MQTEGIIFTGVGQVVVGTLDMPEPQASEVRVRTRYSTISNGTEGWILQNLFTWAPTPYPCVPGYERVGVIEALGPGVSDWQVGERVFATVSTWQGAVHPASGSHIARANTRVEELYRVPEAVDDLDASGAVVAQVGWNAASRAAFEPGDWVLVYGDGLIGQCAAQAARARGASVILVGHRAARLALAAQFSADVVIDNRAQEVLSTVREHTGGKPVVAVLDSVQSERTQEEYMPLLEHARGQIVYCGFTPGSTWADMGLLQRHELTTHFISGWRRHRLEATLAGMATGQMRLRPLITHCVPYTHGPEMYSLHADKANDFLGLTLDWRAAA